MKIGVDVRMYSQSGIGRYIRGLIGNLQKIDKKNSYFILLSKQDFDEVDLKDNFQKVLADFAWYSVSEQIGMPKLLNSLQLDLVHFPHFNVPIFYGGKFVVTIHDLIHQHFQTTRATTHGESIYRIKKFGYSVVFKSAVVRSSKILVPSDFVKNQLISESKVQGKKIIVTSEGVDHAMENIAKRMTGNKSLKIVENLGVKVPYLFYMGNAHPHKNIEKLISVFRDLAQKYKQLNLVLSGADHYFWDRIRNEVLSKNNTGNIIFTGFVTDEQAIALYKNAVAYVFPSLEEGFGIPLLEAMACSCPVVSSNAGSLPEIGADACVYFDPKSNEDMFQKIESILNSETLRKDLIQKGLKRYTQFSWEKLAKQTLEVYENCYCS